MDAKHIFARRPHLVPSLIAAVVLLIALAEMPYGYYRFLRIVTCVAAAFVAYSAYAWKKHWGVWVFGVVAVLFNPLVPIYLSREVWIPIDIAAAGLFAAGIFLLIPPARTDETSSGEAGAA